MMNEECSIAGIPVLAQRAAIEQQGPVVIVIHGMSTTAETMRAGWPEQDDGLSRIYWRLPVLREGREAVVARRQRDLFRELFWPVVEESRNELQRLVEHLAPRPVGLLGFSIGGLISLWGGADNPSVRGVVAIGGVPDLEYLQKYYPDYPWSQPDVVQKRRAANLLAQPERLLAMPTLILHGLADDVANWSWMEPMAAALARLAPTTHQSIAYPQVKHRLSGESPEEEGELVGLREKASHWLKARLA